MSFSQWWPKLRNKRYRDQLVASQVKQMIPMQIAALMKQHGLNQAQLAERSGLTQGAISRAADLDYGNLTLNTIIRIASGFDVGFVGQFVPFSDLVRYLDEGHRWRTVARFSAEDRAIQEAENRERLGPSRITDLNEWKNHHKSAVGPSFPMPTRRDAEAAPRPSPPAEASNGADALGEDFQNQSGIVGGVRVSNG